MKVSRLFAGLLIVLLGLALFLSNFDVLTLNWHFIFRLWPVLLVFAGISVLVSNSKWRAVLYSVTAILVLVWVFSVASVGWGTFHGFFHDGRDVHTQELSQEIDKDIRHAVLTVNAGAGSFNLSDTTSQLIAAFTESNIGDYSLDTDKEGKTERLDLSLEGSDNHWRFGDTKNKVELKLNTKPDWDLRMNVGACSMDYDLTAFAVNNVDVKAGASSIRIRIGDKSDTTRLSLDTGVSSVTIFVPESSGCGIRDNAKLSSKSFPDFTETNDGSRRTSNYDTSKKKVFIDVQAGVSSIKVRRY